MMLLTQHSCTVEPIRCTQKIRVFHIIYWQRTGVCDFTHSSKKNQNLGWTRIRELASRAWRMCDYSTADAASSSPQITKPSWKPAPNEEDIEIMHFFFVGVVLLTSVDNVQFSNSTNRIISKHENVGSIQKISPSGVWIVLVPAQALRLAVLFLSPSQWNGKRYALSPPILPDQHLSC